MGVDAVAVSCYRTGGKTPMGRLVAVNNTMDKPVLMESGMNPDNTKKLMKSYLYSFLVFSSAFSGFLLCMSP
jgi:predicted TIM-barrel enzyme